MADYPHYSNNLFLGKGAFSSSWFKVDFILSDDWDDTISIFLGQMVSNLSTLGFPSVEPIYRQHPGGTFRVFPGKVSRSGTISVTFYDEVMSSGTETTGRILRDLMFPNSEEVSKQGGGENYRIDRYGSPAVFTMTVSLFNMEDESLRERATFNNCFISSISENSHSYDLKQSLVVANIEYQYVKYSTITE